MTINTAIVGLGLRGKATLERLKDIPEARVVCLCDSSSDVEGLPADVPFCTSWQDAVSRPEVQLVYVCTPWDCHTEIAVTAMQEGKHVALEVPAATTVEDCRLLVETSLQTSRQCVLLENCCYDTWHLGVLEIVRRGLLGEIVRLEGAYIHTVGDDWMISLRRRMKGNPYPTHGLGPMCQLLHPADCMEYLVSMDSHQEVTGDNVNDTLIHTQRGVTMLLQYDTSTPRPYNRLQTVCGTLGFAQKYPLPTIQVKGDKCPDPSDLLLTGSEAEQYVESCIASEFKQLIEDGRKLGVKNVMNYIMDRRLYHALLHNLPADISVQEAALWSSFTELTALSAMNEGSKVAVPNF